MEGTVWDQVDARLQHEILTDMRGAFPGRLTFLPDGDWDRLIVQLRDLEARELCCSGLFVDVEGEIGWAGSTITPGGMAFLEQQAGTWVHSEGEPPRLPVLPRA